MNKRVWIGAALVTVVIGAMTAFSSSASRTTSESAAPSTSSETPAASLGKKAMPIGMVKALTALAQTTRPGEPLRSVLPEGRGRSLDRVAPAVPWPGPWPMNLDEARRAGADLSKLDEVDQVLIDRKLGLLVAIDKCLEKQPVGDLMLHLSFNVEGGRATPVDVELTDSSLPDSSADDAVLSCIRTFHAAHPVILPGEQDGPFSWRPTLHLPTKDDRVFRSVLGS